MGLCRPKAVIESREEFGAELRGDDSASAPVGRIGTALDQFRGFQLIEEVGHDPSVDSKALRQAELAANSALSRGRQALVPPRTAPKAGHRTARGPRVRPQDHAQSPTDVA